MQLAFTGFLAGGIALLIPIVLHLIKQKPTQRVAFPSLRFLKTTLAQRAARNKFRKRIILLLRCLCLLGLIFAFCWPFLERFSKEPEEVTIVLWDHSFSMHALPYAKELRRKCIEKLDLASPEHPMLLGVVSEKVEWSERFTGSAQELRVAFESLAPGEGSSSFDNALRLADARLSAMPGKVKTIVLITDQQAQPWKTIQTEKKLSPGVKLSVITPQNAGFINAAITQVSAQKPYGGPGTEVTLDVHVSNFSDTHLKGSLLSFLEGKEVTVQSVELPAYSQRVHSVKLKGQKNLHAGEVRLVVEDDLVVDNTRWFSLNPALYPSVYVNRSAVGSVDFLELAFNPSPSSISTAWKMWPDKFSAEAMSQADLLIVRDGFSLHTRTGEQFLKAIEQGGSAVIYWSDTPETRNLLLQFGISAALLPNERTTEFGFIDFDHPVFKPFLEAQVGSFFNILFFSPPTLIVPEDAQVIATYKDGPPALVELAVGKGRLLIVAIGEERRHTNWPSHATYLPFWREVLSYCKKMSPTDRPQEVSSSPLYIPELIQARSVEHGEIIPVDTFRLPVSQSGNYKLIIGNTSRILSVNVPAIESDPAQLPREFNFSEISSSEKADSHESAPLQPMDQGKSYWYELFILAALAALGELLLANRTVL